MKEITRKIESRILQSLTAFPVVYIAGPRQSGKTTLAKRIATTKHKAQYITFDDVTVRSAAQRDPGAFLRSLKGNIVLDEVQMVPEIFRPLKIVIDENRNTKNGGRGKFLLTGSASIMALPKLSDALVGRMALHTLLPFSACEVHKPKHHNFIERLFDKKCVFDHLKKLTTLDTVIASSFPELSSMQSANLRYEWCNGYLNTILQRDIRLLMEIDKIASLPGMLHLLASQTGGLLNEANLARSIELNHVTTKKYRVLLEGLFLTLSIPAWPSNLGKRLVKSPKVYINDINLLLFLLNVNLKNLNTERPRLFGQLIENFVANELNKQLTFSNTHARLFHYRTNQGSEIDFLLEGPGGRIVAVEVKTNRQVVAKDFRHIECFKEDIGNKFLRGVVLYQGNDTIAFDNDLLAIPIDSLWQ